MIDRVLDIYESLVDRVIVVVHPSFAEVMATHARTTGRCIELVVQEIPTGMLDAVLLPRELAGMDAISHVWITWCDQVAIHPDTAARLAALSVANPHALLVLPTVRRRAPYIHLERDRHGRIVRILHRREGDSMPETGESDMGLFSLSREAYLEYLPQYARQPETGAATDERNFLPFIAWAAAHGDVVTFPCLDEIEAVGINTAEELALIESYLERRDAATTG